MVIIVITVTAMTIVITARMIIARCDNNDGDGGRHNNCDGVCDGFAVCYYSVVYSDVV